MSAVAPSGGQCGCLAGAGGGVRSAVISPASAPPKTTRTAPLNGENKPAKKVQPYFDGDGQACCPIHRKPLSEGRYGLYCSAKAKPGEEHNDKGYCSLRFTDE